jgi:hypothetical protein
MQLLYCLLQCEKTAIRKCLLQTQGTIWTKCSLIMAYADHFVMGRRLQNDCITGQTNKMGSEISGEKTKSIFILIY